MLLSQLIGITNKKYKSLIKQKLEDIKHLPGIYMIKNKINNKIYIGMSKDVYNRIYSHFMHFSNTLLQKAIIKYGFENFEVKILEYQNKLDYEKLLEKEDYYIKKFNSLLPNGYNLKTSGNEQIVVTVKNKTYDEIYGSLAEKRRMQRSGIRNGNFKEYLVMTIDGHIYYRSDKIYTEKEPPTSLKRKKINIFLIPIRKNKKVKITHAVIKSIKNKYKKYLLENLKELKYPNSFSILLQQMYKNNFIDSSEVYELCKKYNMPNFLLKNITDSKKKLKKEKQKYCRKDAYKKILSLIKKYLCLKIPINKNFNCGILIKKLQNKNSYQLGYWCQYFNIEKAFICYNIFNNKYIKNMLQEKEKFYSKKSYKKYILLLLRYCDKIYKKELTYDEVFENLFSKSILSEKLWRLRGYPKHKIKKIISNLQKERSPRCVEYWLKRGYTIEEAKKEVSKVQANNSKRRYKNENKINKN